MTSILEGRINASDKHKRVIYDNSLSQKSNQTSVKKSNSKSIPKAPSKNLTQNNYTKEDETLMLKMIFKNVKENFDNIQVPKNTIIDYINSKLATKENFLFNHLNFMEEHEDFKLKFIIFLLTEEIELLTKKIFERDLLKDNILEYEHKVEKRNNIIDQLLREKLLFGNFLNKTMTFVQDNRQLIDDLFINVKDIEEISYLAKGSIMNEIIPIKQKFKDIQILQEFTKEYFTEKDYELLITCQSHSRDPQCHKHFQLIETIQDSFSDFDYNKKIRKEYQIVVNEQKNKEDQYNELKMKYNSLYDDFLLLSRMNLVKLQAKAEISPIKTFEKMRTDDKEEIKLHNKLNLLLNT